MKVKAIKVREDVGKLWLFVRHLTERKYILKKCVFKMWFERVKTFLEDLRVIAEHLRPKTLLETQDTLVHMRLWFFGLYVLNGPLCHLGFQMLSSWYMLVLYLMFFKVTNFYFFYLFGVMTSSEPKPSSHIHWQYKGFRLHLIVYSTFHKLVSGIISQYRSYPYNILKDSIKPY